MMELPLVELANGLIQALQNSQTFGSDAGPHHAAVVGLTLTRDHTAFLHAVEQAGDVRIVRDHAIADIPARESGGLGAAQDAQDVVLRAGEAVGFEESLG